MSIRNTIIQVIIRIFEYSISEFLIFFIGNNCLNILLHIIKYRKKIFFLKQNVLNKNIIDIIIKRETYM